MEMSNSPLISLHKDLNQADTDKLSTARMERIQARKLKVDSQLADGYSNLANVEHLSNTVTEFEIPGCTESRDQIKESEKLLNSIQVCSHSHFVLGFPDSVVSATKKESSRRFQAIKNTPNVNGDEISHEAEDMAGISINNDIMDPYVLNDLLTKKRQTFLKSIREKEEKIVQLRKIINDKDKDYADELKTEAVEVYLIFADLNKQIGDYERSMRAQLETIESCLLKDRHSLLKQTFNNWDRIFKLKLDTQRKYYEGQSDRAARHLSLHETTLNDESEDDRRLKEKLEFDINILKMKLQETKATFQLNSEKLEYNYQVLKKREDENGGMISVQKRKINKLNDQIALLKSKLQKQQDTFEKDLKNLQDECDRVYGQWKEFDQKCRLFQDKESRLYEELKEMFRDDIETGLRDIISADQVLWEQIVGMEWTPPPEWIDYVDTRVGSSKDGNCTADDFKSAITADFTFISNLSSEMKNLILDSVDTKEADSISTHLKLLSKLGINSLKEYRQFKEFLSAMNLEEGGMVSVILEWISSQRKLSSSVGTSLDHLKQEKKYWADALRVMESPRFEIWKPLKTSIGTYQNALSKRESLVRELGSLKAENSELKQAIDRLEVVE